MADNPSGIRVQASAKVINLTRANAIAHMAREFAQAVMVEDERLNTILVGFRRGLLERVQFLMYSSSLVPMSDYLAYLSFEVDWENHLILLTRGSTTSQIPIDPGIGVTEQLSPMLAALKAYIAEVAISGGVGHVKVTYTIRSGKKQEFRDQFNTVSVSDDLTTALREAQERARQMDTTIRARDHMFGDVGVTFMHRDPPAADK